VGSIFFSFGAAHVLSRGIKYPIHPLDLSLITNSQDDSGNNVTVCISALSPGAATPGDLDAIFGDTIMRNVYTVYASPSPSNNPS
jgi:hypothetical protein